MISSTSNKKISIHITTFKPGAYQVHRTRIHEMDTFNNKKLCKAKTVLCAICLNSKSDEKNHDINKKKTKSCPICQKNCDFCQSTNKRVKEKVYSGNQKEPNVKTVQTSDTNVTQGLNLLNEVLTVFQNKKEDMNKERIKSAHLRDVAVSTDDNKKIPSRLTVSTFHYSIDETKKPLNGEFTIVSSCQPDFVRKSQYSIDLIKHKSSSIPQMKLEELKYSLKEKSKSKDAIEEVNRMFATVRKADKSLEHSNRPMVRNGPRVLPVVKNLVRQEAASVNVDSTEKVHCKCCQTCMSSGDSFVKPECYHDEEKSEKFTHMFCHQQNKRRMHTDMFVCEHCRSTKDSYNCEYENCDDCC